MRKKGVLLIGTSHTYQYGVGAAWGKSPCTPAQEYAFREFVRASAIAHRAKGIAEELHAEGLSEVGKTHSVLQVLAEELSLPHIFCELSRSERSALGIEQENGIRISLYLAGRPETDVEELMREQFRKREIVWLQRLKEFSHWPVLYVCGANHVPSFTELLSDSNVPCELLHSDWQA